MSKIWIFDQLFLSYLNGCTLNGINPQHLYASHLCKDKSFSFSQGQKGQPSKALSCTSIVQWHNPKKRNVFNMNILWSIQRRRKYCTILKGEYCKRLLLTLAISYLMDLLLDKPVPSEATVHYIATCDNKQADWNNNFLLNHLKMHC